jgi:hypothetical protein
MTDKYDRVLRKATQIFVKGPDWVSFYRDVLGVGGIVQRAFPNPAELARFGESPQAIEIQQMLGRLWAANGRPPEDQEPMRVITVRLPRCLHAALRKEAEDLGTSMNRLCISKLMEVMETDLAEVGPSKVEKSG